MLRRAGLIPRAMRPDIKPDDDTGHGQLAWKLERLAYARALEEGAEKYLVGRPSQIIQRRYNQPETAFSA